ncbi:MAG: hypothetical protein RR182_01880 [Alistipes sp.]
MKTAQYQQFFKEHKAQIIFLATIATLFAVASYLIIVSQLNITHIMGEGKHPYQILGKWLAWAVNNIFDSHTFFHPNCWIVLVCLIGFLVVSFLIIEFLLLNYQCLHDKLDFSDSYHKTKETRLCNVTWTMYYFGLWGALTILIWNELDGKLSTFALLIGLTYLIIACFYNQNWVQGLIRFLVIILIDTILYIYCGAIVYLAFLLIIIGIFKFLGSLGGVSLLSEQKAYNNEADDLTAERNRLINDTDAQSYEINDLSNKINAHNSKNL